jgi:hypothetical protein
MMLVPFLVLVGGFAAIWYGRRGLAMGLWGLGLVLLLVLFRLHATSTLSLGY